MRSDERTVKHKGLGGMSLEDFSIIFQANFIFFHSLIFLSLFFFFVRHFFAMLPMVFRVERVPMEITRWRSEKGDALSNYVLLQSHLCMDLDQASRHGQGPEAVFDAETVKRIDAKLATFQKVGERHKLH